MPLCCRNLLVVILVLAPMLAQAASWDEKLKPEARVQFQSAIKLYNAQLYAKAAAAFRNAYLVDSAPKLLFSIAQSQRLAGDCAQAIDSYQAFLRTNPESAAATLARENMALCTPPAADPKVTAPGAEPVVSPIAVAPPAETDVTRAMNAPVPPPAGRDVLTGALLGTAGASIIGATVFAVLEHNAMNARNASTTYDAYARNNSRASSDGAIALTLGAVAIGCAGTSVWRLLHRVDDE